MKLIWPVNKSKIKNMHASDGIILARGEKDHSSLNLPAKVEYSQQEVLISLLHFLISLQDTCQRLYH